MSKTIPHHLCTRQTIIEKGEALSAAIKKYPNKALQTVLILIKALFGYVPEVIQVFLKEDVVLRCHNDIDPKKDVLEEGVKSSAEKCKRPQCQRRKQRRLKQKRKGNSRYTVINRRKKKKHSKKGTRKCGRKLNLNGFAVRITINRSQGVIIFLVPVVFCPDCRKRRRLEYFRKLQYCHRLLLPEMVKRSRYLSEVFEDVIVREFKTLLEDVGYCFEMDHETAIVRDFQRKVRMVYNTFHGPVVLWVDPETVTLERHRGEQPSRKDHRRLRLKRMVAFVQTMVASDREEQPVKNWYNRLRLCCSDSNGDLIG